MVFVLSNSRFPYRYCVTTSDQLGPRLSPGGEVVRSRDPWHGILGGHPEGFRVLLPRRAEGPRRPWPGF